ncbi:hypothetical protein ElyMa_002340700 [Elysia marginata]|uniref:Chitin-binding type-2 domain-containing protein n=1 Tax=Elysia marginata TaxID=1093978 RepID=A0AAV4G7I8_9GAST|nr:hypothetical protein ElyMa_002340700 [Elysia marginata]
MKTSLMLTLVGVVAMLASAYAQNTHSEERPICVDITQSQPCNNVAPGMYEICNMCHYGYYALCSESGRVMTKACPFTEEENEESPRLIFDSYTQSCVVESRSCAKQLELGQTA